MADADPVAGSAMDQLAGYWAMSVPELTELMVAGGDALLATIVDKVAGCRQQVTDVQVTLETERAQRRQLELHRDRMLNQQETRLKSLSAQQERLQGALASAQSDKERAEVELQQLRDASSAQAGSVDKASEELAAARNRIEALEKSLKDVNELLERRAEQYQVDSDEQQSLLDKLASTRSENRRLENELYELRSKEAEAVLREQRVIQERDLVRQNVEWLEKELTTKTSELQRQRLEYIEERTQLQTDLSAARGEETAATRKAAMLEERLTASTEKLERILDQHRQLEQQRAEMEAAFKAEVESLSCVYNMSKKGLEEARDRVAQLEGITTEMRLAADQANERCRLVEEHEAATREELTTRLEEQASELDRVQHELQTANQLIKERQAAEKSAEASMIMSPTASAVARVQKSGKSFTEVYADYVRVQEELAVERREMAQQKQTIAEIMEELVERQPMVEKLYDDYHHMREEASQMSGRLSEALAERETFAKQADEARINCEHAEREVQALKKESDRLALQVQHLLYRQNGSMDGVSRLAPAGVPGAPDEQIVGPLKTFDDIKELQEQNTLLQRINDELCARLDALEALSKQKMSTIESESIKEAEKLIQELREQLRMAYQRVDSYTLERDLLRRMLSNAGHQLPPVQPGQAAHPTSFGTIGELSMQEAPHTPEPHSVFSSTPAPGSSQTPMQPELAEVLRELQVQFDAYRKESGADLCTLKKQLDESQQQASEYRVKHAQATAEINYLNERHQVSLDTSGVLREEINALRERNAELLRHQGQHELIAHKANEELLTAKEAQDRLRQECANLQAEKQLYISNKEREVQENNVLSAERANLTEIMRSMERMHKDLERSSVESRQQFDQRVESLEGDLKLTKEKLKNEVEAGRTLQMRKDVESKDYQTRIDQLNKEQHELRERLAVSTTSLDHQEKRVAELESKLQTAEERLKEFTRPTTGDSEIPLEEKQRQELQRLRSELLEAKQACAKAAEQVEQYKAISAASEEALQQLQTTSTEFQASADKKQAEQAVTITNLRERLENVSTELIQVEERNQKLQQEISEERATWEREKQLFSERSIHLNREIEQAAARRDKLKSDLKQQVELASAAHQQYQNELVAHAADITRMTEIKNERGTLQRKISELESQAEMAKASLTSAQASWEEQSALLKRNATELEERCSELTVQNNNLRAYLDSAAAAASTIQAQSLEPSTAVEDETGEAIDTAAAAASNASQQLQVINEDLRRESTRMRSMLDLKENEARRLQLQLTQTERQLTETRALIMEERMRQSESLQSAAQHSELMDKVNQLNMVRESNITLRNERDQAIKKTAKLEEKVNDFKSKQGPLEMRVAGLQADVEAKDSEIVLLRDDSRHWKDRAQQILQNYQRIDPVEHEELKEAKEKLQTQLKEAQEVQTSVEQQYRQAQQEVAQEKQTNTTLKAYVAKWRAHVTKTSADKASLEQQLNETRTKLAVLQTSVDSSQSTKAERDALAQAKENLEKQVTKLEQECSEQTGRLGRVTEAARNKLIKLRTDYEVKLKERENEIATLRSGSGSGSGGDGDGQQQRVLEAKLKERVVLQEKQLQALRSRIVTLQATGSQTATIASAIMVTESTDDHSIPAMSAPETIPAPAPTPAATSAPTSVPATAPAPAPAPVPVATPAPISPLIAEVPNKRPLPEEVPSTATGQEQFPTPMDEDVEISAPSSVPAETDDATRVTGGVDTEREVKRARLESVSEPPPEMPATAQSPVISTPLDTTVAANVDEVSGEFEVYEEEGEATDVNASEGPTVVELEEGEGEVVEEDQTLDSMRGEPSHEGAEPAAVSTPTPIPIITTPATTASEDKEANVDQDMPESAMEEEGELMDEEGLLVEEISVSDLGIVTDTPGTEQTVETPGELPVASPTPAPISEPTPETIATPEPSPIVTPATGTPSASTHTTFAAQPPATTGSASPALNTLAPPTAASPVIGEATIPSTAADQSAAPVRKSIASQFKFTPISSTVKPAAATTNPVADTSLERRRLRFSGNTPTGGAAAAPAPAAPAAPTAATPAAATTAEGDDHVTSLREKARASLARGRAATGATRGRGTASAALAAVAAASTAAQATATRGRGRGGGTAGTRGGRGAHHDSR